MIILHFLLIMEKVFKKDEQDMLGTATEAKTNTPVLAN